VNALDTDSEGLFVKNLENVQGDERGAILFSITFSANEKGFLPLNYVPLAIRPVRAAPMATLSRSGPNESHTPTKPLHSVQANGSPDGFRVLVDLIEGFDGDLGLGLFGVEDPEVFLLCR
jgi:hypothetical protein